MCSEGLNIGERDYEDGHFISGSGKGENES